MMQLVHTLICQKCGFPYNQVGPISVMLTSPPDCVNPSGTPHKFQVKSSLLPNGPVVTFRWLEPQTEKAIEFTATNIEQFGENALDAAIDARRATGQIHGTSKLYPEVILELKVGPEWLWPQHVHDQQNFRLPRRGQAVTDYEPPSDAILIRESYRNWWLVFIHEQQVALGLAPPEKGKNNGTTKATETHVPSVPT